MEEVGNVCLLLLKNKSKPFYGPSSALTASVPPESWEPTWRLGEVRVRRAAGDSVAVQGEAVQQVSQ